MNLIKVTGQKMEKYPWEAAPSLKTYPCVMAEESIPAFIRGMLRNGIENITVEPWEGEKC